MTAPDQLEMIEDDLQIKIDDFLDKLSEMNARFVREFKDKSLRSTMVDYPHVNPDEIRAIYKKLIDDALSAQNMQYYDEKWKSLLRLG